MKKRHIRHPFPPIVASDARVLILGSVPSVKSVEHNFYYMHPQNRFWRVLSILLDFDFVGHDIDVRAEHLKKRYIAMYDSVEECDIDGSADNAISNVIPSDIEGIIRGTNIAKILCNGATSYKYLIKYHPNLQPIALKLPSTSPANAAFSIEKLCERWKILLDYIQ